MSEGVTLPGLALRVGVTGKRDLTPEQIKLLRGRVDDVLRQIQSEMMRLSTSRDIQKVFASDMSKHVPVALRAVSPLAEGADRLVAEAALDLGYALLAPLPFPQAEYEKDFPGSTDDFRRLLAKAEVVELDGARAAVENPSYEAAGRFVARNCDVLIAIWDGKPARGQGGTADIVHFAARSDVPIWWINVETGETRLIANISQYRRLDLALDEIKAADALRTYLATLVLPPVVADPSRHGIMGRFARFYCRAVGHDPHPLQQFLEEDAPGPSRGLWRAFDRFYRVLSPADPGTQGPLIAENDTQQYWNAPYIRADKLSVFYGDKYRSSYVLIVVLALLTFLLSLVGLRLGGQGINVLLEFVMLCGIGVLVWNNQIQGWQERWIAYRLLAELFRKQIMLAHLGRALPGSDINRVTSESSSETDHAALPREAWVSWYYLAMLRGAPFPARSAVLAKKRAFEDGRRLVAEQEHYHRAREKRAERADRRLLKYSDLFFFFTLIGLVIILVHLSFGKGDWIETTAVLFSGVSGAFVALRAYAEFALLSQQSKRMEKIMRETAAELDDLDLMAPLASQELGNILQRLVTLMMQDVGGWAQLFRLKTVETG